MDHDKIIEKNAKYFHNQWSSYDSLNHMGDQNFVQHLLRCTASQPNDWKNKTIFEGGAGIGRNVVGAIQLGATSIVATELSVGGVQAIITNTKEFDEKIEDVYSADLCNLEIEEDNKYDLTFSVNCIPHIPDYKLAINELVRICKPGGLIMFNVPPQRPKLIEKNDTAIRKFSTQFDIQNAKIFAKIMVYFANTPEIANALKNIMELSGDELSAIDHYTLPYTSSFTKEEIIEVMNSLNCKILKINDLISIKAQKL